MGQPCTSAGVRLAPLEFKLQVILHRYWWSFRGPHHCKRVTMDVEIMH